MAIGSWIPLNIHYRLLNRISDIICKKQASFKPKPKRAVKLMKQSGRIQVVILILFFLSGASGLIYEVVWQGMLNLVFGNTTFATTTVIASFMGGLALGSFCFGRLADRYKKPLRLYAYLQVSIGVFAILFPFILSGISAIHISIYHYFQPTFYVSSLIKFALCFLVLLIPSFLMGGTLPVISKFFVKKFEN